MVDYFCFKLQVFGGDEDQIKAAHLIANCPVVVMSGKGGCGKTFVVSQVLSRVNENVNLEKTPTQQQTSECSSEQESSGEHGKSRKYSPEQENSDEPSKSRDCCISEGPILLTAPTGKAAAILGKRTNLPAHTLHHVIHSFFHHLSAVKDQTSSSPWKFADVCMLVVDECSLVSVQTFSTLIDILRKNSKIQQLVLLGDINQLPSIEPGNFLEDIYKALEPHGLSITLRTNHRSEAHLIVDNANSISKKRLPEFDPESGFEAVHYDLSNEQDMGITKAVRHVLKEKNLPQESSQFIAFRNKDCDNINELCSQHYNHHPVKDHRGKADFQVRDKVCIGRNRNCFDHFSNREIRLCNGEIFIIRNDVTEEDNRMKKTRYFELDDQERLLKIEFLELKKGKMKHAWARTIHTYQVSLIYCFVCTCIYK